MNLYKFIIIVAYIWLIFSICTFLFYLLADSYKYNSQQSSLDIRRVYLITFFVIFWLFLYYVYNNDYSFGQLYITVISGFIFAVDSKSLFLVFLTVFLFPIISLASWKLITEKVALYYWLLLTLELFLVLTFFSFDLFIFYVFFESSLIPMVLLIGIWGTRERKINAAFYFFLYTFAGSIVFLISIAYIYIYVGNTCYFYFFKTVFSFNQQKFLWLAFFFAFAVKVPIIPFHLWLPEAHVEAATPVSMLLAGIFLKLGYYGFMRFFQVFPLANVYFYPIIYSMCFYSVIMAAFIAVAQIDLKKLIAYSSISHMNLCVISLFSDFYGFAGSYIMTIGHGIVSPALFFMVGKIYERNHSRLISYYSGLSISMPLFTSFFFYFIISNFSFPLSINFIGELSMIISLVHWSYVNIPLLLIYSFLSVAYNLFVFSRIFFGTSYLSVSSDMGIAPDITKLEIFVLLPLTILNFSLFLCTDTILFLISY